MPLSIFSHLPHHWCRQVGSRGSCFVPLSIMFQSFSISVLYARGFRRLILYATLNIDSVIYHSFSIGRGGTGGS
jgi:hypothetical protein